jgi:hypothetical protein
MLLGLMCRSCPAVRLQALLFGLQCMCVVGMLCSLATGMYMCTLPAYSVVLFLFRAFVLPCVSCPGVPLQVPLWQVSHSLYRASALFCICMWSGGLSLGLALGAVPSVAFTGHVLCPGTGPKVTPSLRNCRLGVCTCKYNE